jgi:large subunit ribosomal protein L30
MAQIAVTQVKSSIATKPKHRGTLRALGLGRIGKRNVLPDRPEIRGMIAKVPHLITVAETDEVATPARRTSRGGQGAPDQGAQGAQDRSST